MDELLTTQQLQDLLKIDRTTIYRMLKDGRLVGIKVGGRWRFSREEVEALLSSVRSAGEQPGAVSTSVLPLHCIQAIQEVFAEISGVGSVTTMPDGEPLTEISNCCRFCELILASETGRRACIASWRKFTGQPQRQPKFADCHAGLQYARARIEVNGTFTAMLFAGQFYAVLPDPDEGAARIAHLAEIHGLDHAALAEAAGELSALDDHRQAQLEDCLEKVAHTLEIIGRERAELVGRLQRIAAISAFESA